MVQKSAFVLSSRRIAASYDEGITSDSCQGFIDSVVASYMTHSALPHSGICGGAVSTARPTTTFDGADSFGRLSESNAVTQYWKSIPACAVISIQLT